MRQKGLLGKPQADGPAPLAKAYELLVTNQTNLKALEGPSGEVDADPESFSQGKGLIHLNADGLSKPMG
jgi:hypothetical protein